MLPTQVFTAACVPLYLVCFSMQSPALSSWLGWAIRRAHIGLVAGVLELEQEKGCQVNQKGENYYHSAAPFGGPARELTRLF